MADPSETVDQAPELSIEQRRAIALARARRQRTEDQGSGDEDWGNALGRTARAMGPSAVGAAAGAALGAPLLGVGAVPGAGMGMLAMNLVHLADRLGGTNHLDTLMDRMGLPRPKNPSEEMAQAVTESMANMAGMTGAAMNLAKNAAPGIIKETSKALAATPGLGAVSAATGGAAQEQVRQEPLGIVPDALGGNQTEQFLANLVGSALPVIAAPTAGVLAQAPGVRRVAQTAKNVASKVSQAGGDVKAAVGAAFGHQPSINKLASDVVESILKDTAPEVRDALGRGTTYAAGATPTVAEALAEANQRNPTRQIGGALIKLQDEISGAKGVEDLLPSKMKANQAAIDTHIADTESKAAALRNMAFESARRTKGPNILGPQIDLLLLNDNAQLRNNKIAGMAINELNKQLAKSGGKSGFVDPEALYSIRQNSRQLINKFIDQGLSRDHAAYILGQFNRGIDKAMVDGGAVGWKAYLDTYSQGMAAAEAHAARLKTAANIAQGIGSQAPEGAVREVLPHIPTLLHRPTMFANFMLKLIAKDATEPVTREIATRLQDPEQFAQLIRRPDGTPAKHAVNQVLLNAAILSNLVQKHQADQEKEKQ